MKKTICWILIFILLQSFSITTYGAQNLSYEASEQGIPLYRTIQFNDIAGHWAKPAIQEAGALSLMSGLGNGSFEPNRSLTALEALASLIKGIGKEADAQRFGEVQRVPKVREILTLSAVDEWAKGYIQVAIDNGILTQAEVDQMLNLTSAQMTSLEQQAQKQLQSYGGDITPEELKNLETQIRQQLQINAVWKKPVTRQQIAQWAARAIQLEPVYGEKIAHLYNLRDWEEIDTEKIPLVEAVLQKGIMTGTSANTFSPKQSFTRGQMAQLMVNIHDQLLPLRKLKKNTGEILGIQEIQQGAGKNKILTLHNEDNSKADIHIEAGKKEFILRKGDNFGLTEQLSTGQILRYYTNDKNKVVYGVLENQDTKKLQGTIDLVDEKNYQLKLVDFDNKSFLFQLKPSTKVRINDREGVLKDLLYGQEVEITYTGDKITEIKAFLEQDGEQQGYIPPGSRVRVGNILTLKSNSLELKVEEGKESYRLTPETKYLKEGKAIKAFQIKEGDRVMLSFNDPYTTEVDVLRVEDAERHIQAIERGLLEQVNTRTKEILLKDVMLYQQGKWVKHPNAKHKLKVVEEEFYQGSTKITLEQLQKMVGQEVYVAVEGSYGTEKVAKLQVKQGSSLLAQSTIEEILYGVGQIKVDSQSYGFHEGTILVKNNRLVDLLNLEAKQNILMAADLVQGTRQAAVLEIEDNDLLKDRIDGTRLVVYQAMIEDIDDYGIVLGRLGYQLNRRKLQDHQWIEEEGSKKLFVTEDTYIFDSELKKEIESSYFLNSRFINLKDIKDLQLRKRLQEQYYIGKVAYFIVRENIEPGETQGEVVGINLTPQRVYYRGQLLTDHTALGTIKNMDLDSNQLVIEEVKHWNTLNKRWETTGGQETIATEKTIFLLNDQPLDVQQLYKISEKARAYMIKTKTNSTNDEAYIIIIEQ